MYIKSISLTTAVIKKHTSVKLCKHGSSERKPDQIDETQSRAEVPFSCLPYRLLSDISKSCNNTKIYTMS